MRTRSDCRKEGRTIEKERKRQELEVKITQSFGISVTLSYKMFFYSYCFNWSVKQFNKNNSCISLFKEINFERTYIERGCSEIAKENLWIWDYGKHCETCNLPLHCLGSGFFSVFFFPSFNLHVLCVLLRHHLWILPVQFQALLPGSNWACLLPPKNVFRSVN